MSRRSQLDSESSRKLQLEPESSRKLQLEPESSRKLQLEPDSSRKLQVELSPKKSILKASPAKKTGSTARANLMAKDDKKIQFDLNETMKLFSEVTILNKLFGLKW